MFQQDGPSVLTTKQFILLAFTQRQELTDHEPHQIPLRITVD